MDKVPDWLSFTATAAGPIVGVVLAFVLSVLYAGIVARRRAKHQCKTLATSLLVEAMAQADWCARKGSNWNLYEAGSGSVGAGSARRDRPPPAPFYMATVGKIDCLEPKIGSSVIAFHGAVDIVRIRIDSWSRVQDGVHLSLGDVQELAKKWRSACFNGILAIDNLERIADWDTLPNDPAEMARVKRNLRTVAESRVISEPADAAAAGGS